MVEPRLEQAAEVVEQRREQAAEVAERRPEPAAETACNRPRKRRNPPAVIPAQAGIQWFTQSIPARRE